MECVIARTLARRPSVDANVVSAMFMIMMMAAATAAAVLGQHVGDGVNVH